jgi:hypothetical protein
VGAGRAPNLLFIDQPAAHIAPPIPAHSGMLALTGWEKQLTSAIPVAWEAEIRGITVQGQLGQKLVRPHLNKEAGCGGACLSSHTLGRHRQEAHSLRPAPQQTQEILPKK